VDHYLREADGTRRLTVSRGLDAQVRFPSVEATALPSEIRGVAAFFGGVAWVTTTPRVWLRAIVPMATALVRIASLGVPRS
jgi:hypothetical protein